MLASIEDVYEVTGFTADDADVKKAQAIVEVFAGRTEDLISDSADLAWMKYAVCWQVAYMSQDEKSIYEQANIETLHQNDTIIRFGKKTYAVSPLVVKAVSRLSWNKSRAIPTASAYPRTGVTPWEVD